MPETPNMHDGAVYRLASAPVEIREGVMRATDVDDVYFSVENGLAETRHVFLEGNDLINQMRNASHLVIAETGFGSGLNLLAVMAAMADFPALHVDFISVESRPLEPEHMAFVHRQFPEMAPHADALRAGLPPAWPGHHLQSLCDGRLSLHLLYGDVVTCLAGAEFTADAWFLDGFSPAKNPEMWTEQVLRDIGRLTASGGTMASFTAAAKVRNGLTEAGFTVEKRQGFGRKRDMIVGYKSGHPRIRDAHTATASGNSRMRVGIIGAGIGGAAVAHGLSRRGAVPVVLDAGQNLGAGASGNRLALQTPRLAVDHNPASRMSATCLAYAAMLADKLGASRSCPVIALDCPDREAIRHEKFRRQHWPADLVRSIDRHYIADHAGSGIEHGGVAYDYGRVIAPREMVAGLLGDAETHWGFAVTDIARLVGDNGPVFTVRAEDGKQVTVDAVVHAQGAGMGPMLQAAGITGIALDVTSGQVSHIPATIASTAITAGFSFGGYLTPAEDGLHELGATFDRSGAMRCSEQGTRHNLELLPADMQALFADVDMASVQGRVSQRASTPDRNPIMGSVGNDAPGIYVFGALGARGFTLAPLLGDMLAAEILRRPVTLEPEIKRLLDPFRFRMRASRL